MEAVGVTGGRADQDAAAGRRHAPSPGRGHSDRVNDGHDHGLNARRRAAAE